MTMFYLHDGKDQLGPFTLDELKTMNPSPNAHIWHKGLDGWKKAQDIEELQTLFDGPPPFHTVKESMQEEAPPPFNSNPKEAAALSDAAYQFTEPPKRRKGLWIGLAIGVLLLIGILAYNMQKRDYASDTASSGNSYNEPASSPKTPEQLRQELLQKERNDFLTYLQFKQSTTLQPNMVVTQTGSFWRREKKEQQGHMLHAFVSNSATMANYKDLVFTITYQTQTKTVIKAESFTVYQYFKKGETTAFDLLVHPPAEMHFFNVEVSGATPVN